jgi:hypothetical protein
MVKPDPKALGLAAGPKVVGSCWEVEPNIMGAKKKNWKHWVLLGAGSTLMGPAPSRSKGW